MRDALRAASSVARAASKKIIGKRCHELDEENLRGLGWGRRLIWRISLFLEFLRKLDWMYCTTVPVVDGLAGPIGTN
jgi:hypothetical protein